MQPALIKKCISGVSALGVIASSDHRSTNISYGGVYVKTFDRSGLFEAISARRTIAATDKIVMRLSCNGHILGEEFRTKEKPTLKLFVEGTAPLLAVSVIRNNAIVYQAASASASIYDGSFKDLDPVVGENCYYLRVEQADGNMGWTSPVWATYASACRTLAQGTSLGSSVVQSPRAASTRRAAAPAGTLSGRPIAMRS